MVVAGAILPSLAPEEQVGNLSGFEPRLAASPSAIEMSEAAAMEPDVQVFVAEEHVRNLSAEQLMPAAAVVMTAA
jgi:muramidase (phage lysozyme)